MNSYADLARKLSETLRLSLPPIAVCLADASAEGVPRYDREPPAAGCVFWQKAARGVFATSPRDHRFCSIGMYTHNMELTPQEQADLQDALAAFAEIGYLPPDQVTSIPVLQDRAQRVIYAPLAAAPFPPDVVLLFVQPDQALILAEASQAVDKGIAPAMGRPACAVVPMVKNSGHAALSLGCCGARAYVDPLGPAVALWALPGPKLAAYVDQIAVFCRANTTLTRFHQLRRQDVEQGRQPSVKASLRRLQQ